MGDTNASSSAAAQPAKDAKKPGDKDGKDAAPKQVGVLDERDIELLSRYGAGPYSVQIRALEASLLDEMKKVNELIGVKESA
jgi:26S proteasome regulatory subunit T1